ncbi:antiviral reverse transcriptase Drt2 [Conchiformibius kuhniae]|uniref:Antiviral reverse transcriptase Drt2 n=1 Tax=Conchiformibius kuhniae TaxID=211502 RepID=A0A8T9MVJ2_9NEIS|nr:antiviral reverse transcriptase Drt2 [Conchiformibius kuhniae]UOP04162.1 reverse transcriptase/maturase family protein [Conchiformibius kuhniae]
MIKKPNHPWFKKKGYLHFDMPISVKQAESLVLSKQNIKSHSFYPFLHYEIPKLKVRVIDGKITRDKKSNPNIKKRPISYAAHRDSHIFAYYNYILSQKYEDIILNSYNHLDKCVLAFRKLGKSNIDFAKLAFDTIRELGNCSVLALDITGFFDNLNHEILKKSWCRILNTDILPEDHYAVYRAITKFSKINVNDVLQHFCIPKNTANLKSYKRICSAQEFRSFRKQYPNKITQNSKNIGIPQGSPISALLSNIYMLDFDISVFEYINKLNKNFVYMRYCDDILCIVNKENINAVNDFVIKKIEELRLTINQEKTEIVHFSQYQAKQLKSDRALQYLGFIMENNSISLRSTGLTRYSNRMKRGVSLAKQTHRKYSIIRSSRGKPIKKLYKKQLYSRYSHFGRRNFISYGKKAATAFKSKIISKQLYSLHKRLIREIAS